MQIEKLKQYVTQVLNWMTVRYLRRGDVRVIAVAGSVGKTSTASAIRTMLAQRYRVLTPLEPYNTSRSIHLTLFDEEYATTVWGWVKVVGRMFFKLLSTPIYDVVVLELGTDHPGELKTFAWLRPRIGVLTAIAPEHMEHFGSLDSVAVEELTLLSFCDRVILNHDAIDPKFLPAELQHTGAGYGGESQHVASNYRWDGKKLVADFKIGAHKLPEVKLQVIGLHSVQALLAAGALADIYNLKSHEIIAGLEAIKPVPGRMQPLRGLHDSLIIDDTYNASPTACRAALDTLYHLNVTRRVAILGSMNEMGPYSPEAHREVATYCDPAKLSLVVTVGAEAAQFLAPAARERGCIVESFDNPYAAGQYVRQLLVNDAQPQPTAILAKGSQNRIFCEEAVKMLLGDRRDADHLVRQSPYWLKQKRLQFGGAPRQKAR